MQSKKINTWDKVIHAPFRKVVKYDLFCMGLGILIGIGIGVYIVTNL